MDAEFDWKELTELWNIRDGPPVKSLVETVFAFYFTQEATEDADNFIELVIDTYIKMRKVVELHKILFCLFENGAAEFKQKSLRERFCKSYVNAVNGLPAGQMLQIWDEFLTQPLHTLVSMEMFVIFLQHSSLVESQLPHHVVSKVEDKIVKTSGILAQELSKFGKDSTRDSAVIGLCIAYGGVQCTRFGYNSSSKLAVINDMQWWDMNPVHDYEADWESTMKLLFDKSGEIRTRRLLLDLLIQKLKWIDIAAEFTENTSACSHARSSVVRRLLKVFDETPDFVSSANVEIVMQVMKKSKVIPLAEIIFILSDQESSFSQLGSSVREVRELHSTIITIGFSRILTSCDHETLKHIFECLSAEPTRWIEQEQSLPKDKGDIWDSIRSCATEVLAIDATLKMKAGKNFQQTAELFRSYLPLGCLSVSNQLRCLIGFSAILFAEKSFKTKSLIVQTMTDILDGERSIWLFDFCEPAAYLRKVLAALEGKTPEEVPNAESQIFLKLVINRICRSRTTDFTKLLPTTEGFDGIVALVFEVSLLKELTKMKNAKTLNVKMPVLLGLSDSLSKSVLKRLSGLIKQNLDSERAHILIEGFILVVSHHFGHDSSTLKRKTVTRLASKLFDHTTSGARVTMLNSQIFVELLELFCKKRQDLDFSPQFSERMWNFMFPVEVVLNEEEILEDVLPKIKKLRTIIKSLKSEKEEVKIVDIENESSTAYTQNLPISLAESYIKCLDSDELSLAIKKIFAFGKLEKQPEFFIDAVTMHRAIYLSIDESSVANVTPSTTPAICSTFEHLEALSNTFLKLGKTDCMRKPINILLKLCKDILQHGKKVLTDQQVLMLCNSVMIVENIFYDCKDIDLQIEVFTGVTDILKEALISHKRVVISRMASYSALVNRLLQHLIHMSRTDVVQASNLQAIEGCAIGFCKLVDMLCGLHDGYATVAQYYASTYIQAVQRQPIEQNIKKILLRSVYEVVKTVTISDQGDRRLEKVHCCLNPPGREVFKIILSNYEKYHRFRGYV
ncbi:hypothetical protein HDE_02313 [Halotydeus destructor]|nr:hypothetical protein HDE_02313 [Halotydeus destructor]